MRRDLLLLRKSFFQLRPSDLTGPRAAGPPRASTPFLYGARTCAASRGAGRVRRCETERANSLTPTSLRGGVPSGRSTVRLIFPNTASSYSAGARQHHDTVGDRTCEPPPQSPAMGPLATVAALVSTTSEAVACARREAPSARSRSRLWVGCCRWCLSGQMPMR